MADKMIRIACIGDYTARYSYFTAGIMEGAIRLGHWFRPIPLVQPISQIENQVYYFQPHIIFAHQLFGQYHALDEMKNLLKRIRQKDIKIILHAGDPKPEPRFKENISECINMGLINSNMVDIFSEIWDVPCYHWPYFCLQQERIADLDERYKAEVSFSGNVTKRDDPEHPHHGRAEFIKKVKHELGMRIYPNKFVANSRFLTPVVAASSNAVLGIHIGWNVNGYIDTRPFQYIGAGALYFHDRCAAIDQFFTDGVHYVGYEAGNVESFIDRFRYYINQYPEKALLIRQTGFNYCQKNYNTMVRVRQALEWVKNS